MIIVECKQNSPEWFAARLGIPTASGFQKIITSTGARSKQREKYLYELAGEIVTGESSDNYTNSSMNMGHDRESESRETYSFIKDVEIKQVGFCFFDEKKEFGCSPDGLVGENGGFETKNAAPHVHLDRLENGWSKAQHLQQVQGNLYVTDRKWWDLVSYSRGFKPMIIRFERDEEFIKTLADEIYMFIGDLKTLVKKYSV